LKKYSAEKAHTEMAARVNKAGETEWDGWVLGRRFYSHDENNINGRLLPTPTIRSWFSSRTIQKNRDARRQVEAALATAEAVAETSAASAASAAAPNSGPQVEDDEAVNDSAPVVLTATEQADHSCLHGRRVRETFEGEGGGEFEGKVMSHYVLGGVVTFVVKFSDGDEQEYSRGELEIAMV